MLDKKNKFYVTTPIYYVNAKPHLGSLYSTLLADVAARWNQIQGKETFMLTGTDEHGQKVAEAAEKAGKKPQAFVDGLIDSFKSLWPEYHIEYNHFIRTTDAYHVKAVQDWIKKLKEKGDIYKDSYEGWYDTSSEAFLTEKDLEFKKEGQPPISLLSGKPARKVSEECYFFKLSAYQDKLLEFYKNNPDFITPAERLNEVISFVEGGLKDLSISRKTITWGIPFPGDDQHVTYVWADALNNYITAIGYGDKNREQEFKKWWPADLHILGKDIVRFHAIYWPAFLMASDLPLPKKMLVHGWIKVDGEKMSKSIGNVVDPHKLGKEYGIEPVRYYLTRYMATTQDSTFSTHDLEQKINSDLANDLGNLLNRMLTLAIKNNLSIVPKQNNWGPEEQELHKKFTAMVDEFEKEMEGYFFHRAYASLWKFINAVNSYFHAQEPWKRAKSDSERFSRVISATCHSLYGIAAMLWPIMPHSMDTFFGALGLQFAQRHDYLSEFKAGSWDKAFVLTQTEPIFKKHTIVKDQPMETPVEKALEKKQEEKKDSIITFDDFVALEMRVGQITQVEVVEGSEKLLQFSVDFGEYGQRTICAGLKKHYRPEDVVNKKAVFVFNLKPRKIMGISSQGMTLTAEDSHGVPNIVFVGDTIVNGARLK